MKKICCILLGITFSLPGLMAQKSNVIKTDLFSAILRTGVLKYERTINEDMSFQLGLFYTGFSPRESDEKLSGFGITPEFRYYLSTTPAPNGTYIAPNIRYMSLTVEDPTINESGTLTGTGFGINIGKQVLLKDVVIIDAWVGPTYNFRNLKGDVDPSDIPNVDGFGLRLGIAIGFAF